MKYFLGVDIGGTKSHGMISDETGRVVGFGRAMAGNWESVGYDGLQQALETITDQSLNMAGLDRGRLQGPVWASRDTTGPASENPI